MRGRVGGDAMTREREPIVGEALVMMLTGALLIFAAWWVL